MDRDDFIITVYCLVCEHYTMIQDSYPLRRGGISQPSAQAQSTRSRWLDRFMSAKRVAH